MKPRRLRDQLAERITDHIDYHARLELAHTKEQ